ncbi:hypothetical protein AAHB56_13020, partial [Bacillus thuringiensis]
AYFVRFFFRLVLTFREKPSYVFRIMVKKHFRVFVAPLSLGEKLNFMTGIGVVFITAGVLFIAFS